MSLIRNLCNIIFVVIRALVVRSFAISLFCATLFGAVVWYLYPMASEYGLAFGAIVGVFLTACEMGWELFWAIRKTNQAKVALADAHRRETSTAWGEAYRAHRAEKRALEAMNFGTKSWSAWHMESAIDSAEYAANNARKQEDACRW